MKISHACILQLFYVVIADASLRKGRLRVTRADFTSRRVHCSDPHCETCAEDEANPQNSHCTHCEPGFGLKHAAKDCSNCQNVCVPCEVKGCTQCSSLASSCASCEDTLALRDGKCNDDGGAGKFMFLNHASERTFKEWETYTSGNPTVKNPGLVPFQSYGWVYIVTGIVLYLVLAFAVAFCYISRKGPRLQSASGYLPEDGFSDAICECGQSWPICLWACCCPCVRWSDTNSQMRFMSFYLGIFVWCLLTLCNWMFAGLGFLLVMIMGAYYRGRIRAYFGLPRTCMTGFQDVIAWMCCQPCAIAQEARHIERALGLRTNSQR